MFKYALRIDKCLSSVLAWFTKESISGFGVREVADSGEHWHFYLRSEKKLPALRKSLLTTVNELKGNGSYSLTDVKDEDKYLRYICKGDSKEKEPEIIWSYGYDVDSATALHRRYWEENEVLQRRRKAMTVSDAILSLAKERRIQWSDRTSLIREYIRELGNRNKPINLYSVKAAVNAIQLQLCPNDDALEELVSRCNA